jgi:hypothetical protein
MASSLVNMAAKGYVKIYLDLGWGEQFVTSIADVVECAEVFEKTNSDDGNLTSITESP